ncbi:MAG: TatD family hydrolase [Thermoproteota archaeon]|nr:TatD family hydrolase [Thermoproteota archaeon]
MTWLYDSHIHLSDPEFRSDIKQIIHTMDLLSLRACCVSMDFETSVDTLDLSKKSENILPFIGIHPEMAQGDSSEVLDMIEKRNNEITGIGEIGLDRTYITTEEEWIVQKKVFSDQLSLAEKFNKPVSIHSRKTLDEIFEILSSFNLKRILLHWFDGNKNQLKHAMELDLFVSYGPLLVYANDKQTLLSKTNIGQILVETDGPVRFSHCFNQKTTQIQFLHSVVFCASKILKIPYDIMLKQLEKNSNQFLNC